MDQHKLTRPHFLRGCCLVREDSETRRTLMFARGRPRRLRTSLLLVILTVAAPCLAVADDDKVQLIDADPQRGFNFPYYLRTPAVPRPVPQTTLLIETNNTGNPSDDIAVHLASAKALAAGQGLGPFVAAHLRVPFLVPVFPRPASEPKLYTHALDRETMRVESGPLARLDRQLLAMFNDARRRLEQSGTKVRDQFLMCGFSASGTFANRFAFVHSNQLLGVAVGGINGSLMLPLLEHGRHRLPYPIGIGDLEVFGTPPFHVSTWQVLPQLIFMGAEDANDAVQYDDAYSETERRLIYRVLGRRMLPDRWYAAQRLYLEQRASVTFITYGGIGHGTNRRINTDVANFLESVLLKAEKEERSEMGRSIGGNRESGVIE